MEERQSRLRSIEDEMKRSSDIEVGVSQTKEALFSIPRGNGKVTLIQIISRPWDAVSSPNDFTHTYETREPTDLSPHVSRPEAEEDN